MSSEMEDLTLHNVSVELGTQAYHHMNMTNQHGPVIVVVRTSNEQVLLVNVELNSVNGSKAYIEFQVVQLLL